MSRVASASLAGLLLAAAAIVLLERLRPYDRGQPLLRPGFWTDLVGYTAIQSLMLGFVIGALLERLDALAGWSSRGLLSGWSVSAQVALFVVTHDLYIYWFHRLQHRSPRLWRLHEAHHSNADLDALASTRSHALEIFINQTIEFAPLVLLGASPAVAPLKSAVSAVWGLWIHANVDVRTGPLQWFINGPEAHRWHHAVDACARDKNFATKFAFWDRLFGTAYLPRDRRPSGYGLPDVDFPAGYLRQQAFAFRAHSRS